MFASCVNNTPQIPIYLKQNLYSQETKLNVNSDEDDDNDDMMMIMMMVESINIGFNPDV